MLVEMQGITKSFPGVLANDRVDFGLEAGEVHALLGENGAGKSTLMSILTGLYRPDAGRLAIEGRTAGFRAPRDAIRAGIGMVHQHFKLVAPFTVAENVLLGLDEPRLMLNLKQVEERIRAVSLEYGLKVDPAAPVWQLSVGEQQRVEIIKLLYRGARVLILDEPTAVLTPQEADELFKTLRLMAARGHGVIIITHKMHEVMAVSDRCTVLRGGKLVGTVKTAESTPEDLTRMMVGRGVQQDRVKAPMVPGAVSLDVDRIVVGGSRGVPAVRGAALQVHCGEILGIAGVAGNGQRELCEAVAGLRPIKSGAVRMTGNCAFIPEDRLGMGLVPNLTVTDNALLRVYRDQQVSRAGFFRWKAVRDFTKSLMHKFDVKAAGTDTPIKLLSGGNQQKLLVGRELATDPQVIIASQPTRGLDVAATEAVHKVLLEARQRGKAILMVSEDLDELLSVCDRIAVMFEGRVMGTVSAEAANVAQIGLMMAGKSEAEVTPA
ncbi:MAG TPA: ABC transporter ATP-binding protein [Symbiobacteriaceae bacterium]|nr:ABC transporter ATP-binding protein [Symbiobacteriaceae bacterium]